MCPVVLLLCGLYGPLMSCIYQIPGEGGAADDIIITRLVTPKTQSNVILDWRSHWHKSLRIKYMLVYEESITKTRTCNTFESFDKGL